MKIQVELQFPVQGLCSEIFLFSSYPKWSLSYTFQNFLSPEGIWDHLNFRYGDRYARKEKLPIQIF